VAARVGLERRHRMPARCGHCSTCASDQMLRRILPTAERTVTRGGKKILDEGDAIRERPRPCKKFFDGAAKSVGCGHVSGLRWRRKAAGPDEVRGPGLNQIAADIAACLTARCPNPRLDRLASHCLVTLAKRLNSKAKTVRCFEFCDYAVAITGRTSARKFCPFTITAHEIRAVLLAIATLTNRAGRRLRGPLTQSASAAVFRCA